ncbi:hypothetical protein N7532_008022 [Penicillium argentinense]|uniref:NAD(P)-binding domain-containing protein n=1 Tax=Penicillium argentinense TaxID=1131581 RepID=A0A9W9K175_9EURO|nr:uncharacterized protein N7532_008022 [Penicillium argentinense]KAJ5089338.1 hypothetical protein N7532_008022 [Penicillium argentinense]
MSSQPIQKVAIVGATGRIGGAFAKALVDGGKHTVTALTREDSKGKVPDGVHVEKVNYDDEASIIKALKGQQFVAITLGVRAPDDLHSRICAAAGKAGVSYIMPNAYGYPLAPGDVGEEGSYSRLVVDRVNDTKNGVSSYIKLSCGFWYEWSLAIGEQWFGFTIKDRKVTFFDDGKRTITVSSWDQCGRALAALVSLPESGSSPSLADYKNEDCPICSFRVSQRDMLDSLHRVLGTTDSDWEITYEPVEKRIADGTNDLSQGNFTGFAKKLYGGVFLASNPTSDFAATKSANEALALPKEDLDEATKRTVAMVESGWNPFADM